MPKPGGFTLPETRAYFQARRDRQQITVSCALCSWRETGPAGQVMELQRQHAKSHRAAPRRKPGRTTSLGSPKSAPAPPLEAA